jgi:glycyl-tRNA synthetase beta chain
MPDFLLEIGLEEIPARMIADAEAELAKRVEALIVNARLATAGAQTRASSYSTPRRLAVLISDIHDKQPDVNEQLTGPSWGIAFKNGDPTPAAHAFAKKAGVELAALTRIVTAKGEYVGATVHRSGRSASEVLAEQLPKELSALYWPKNMYWRADKPERFVRPLRWLLALLDDQVVPLEFGGISAGNVTYGHRILHGNQPIPITNPAAYLTGLEAAYVIPEVESRRHKIRKALDAAARRVPGLRWREDHPLVDAVTHLTEWPSVVLGSFEEEYLTLPEEVLVTVMRDHQKYFALVDESGKLAPYFLAVLNTRADDAGLAVIRHGNERVLGSRFKDARFFWDFDQKIPLTDRVEMLKAVTFHEKVGNYYEKTEANWEISRTLSARLYARSVSVDEPSLKQAVWLAKTDLTAELVKEFTELQGVIGGLYARLQGFNETIASAIYSQYGPASSESPKSVEGQVLGLADRIHTIVELFSVGAVPTGSRDPFALRRAGNGILALLFFSALPLGLSEVVEAAVNRIARSNAAPLRESLSSFLRERLEFYLREGGGFAYDVVTATLAAGDDNVPDTIARAEALTAVRGSEDFAAISAAFKRIKNILRQAAEKETASDAVFDETLLTDPAEKTLAVESARLAGIVEQLRSERKYREALEKVAALRPHVDRFFDAVMVMVPEPEIRRNRLALIASVLSEFSKIADFSEIVTA